MKRLFNPFEKYTETQLLLFGMLATAGGAVIAWLFKARFDGALDVHFSEHVTPQQTASDLVVDVTTLLLFLWIAAQFINRKIRIVDLLSAVIIARIPFYILPLFNCTGWMSQLGAEVEEQLKAGKQITWVPGPGELVLIIVFALVMILLLVWAIALLYNGYRVATNAKGAKAVVLFIAALLLAEIVSKIALYYLDFYVLK
jgi:hypothetical protein